MIKSTLFTGAFLLTGLCFGQNNFQKHITPEKLAEIPALKSDLDQIRSLEKTMDMAATSSRSRGAEIQSKLQTAYKTYLTDLGKAMSTSTTDGDKKMIADEQAFVTALIH